MSNMYKYRLNLLSEAIPGKALFFLHYTLYFIYFYRDFHNKLYSPAFFCLLAVFFIENYINAQQFVQKSF